MLNTLSNTFINITTFFNFITYIKSNEDKVIVLKDRKSKEWETRFTRGGDFRNEVAVQRIS